VSAGDVIYVFVVFVILLAAVYLAVFFMKKMMFRYDNSAMQNVAIDLIAIRGIMPKKYVGIVKVNKDFYLIGISENNITMLDKLNPEDFDEMNFEKIPQDGKFSDMFKKAFRNQNA